MSLNDARVNMFTYLDTNWSTTSIVFDGNDDQDTYIKSDDPWIYPYLSWGREIKKSISRPSAQFATPGILTIRIYVRQADGIGILDQYTDSLFDLFRGQTISNMMVTSMGVDMNDKDDGWNIRSISIHFTLRESKTIS